MDGWSAMATDASRAVMKITATSATMFLYSGATNASDNPTFYFQGCRQSLGIKVVEVIRMLWTQITHIVLIFITYQSHRAGNIAPLVRRSLGQCPRHFSSQPAQARPGFQLWLASSYTE